MGKEIERKFLVEPAKLPELEEVFYRQGYLSTEPERTVRVRRAGDKAFLTIKGKSVGATRAEYEYEIPVAEADEMLDTLCYRPLIEKFRSKIEYEGLIWELDRFTGENAGLFVAEVELESEEQPFHKPEWVTGEVTGERRYYNSSLTVTPYSRWEE